MGNSLLTIIFRIILLPFRLIRYATLGLFFASYIIIGFFVTTVAKFIKYTLLGIIRLSLSSYHLLKYALKGIAVPFIFLSNIWTKHVIASEKRREKQRIKLERLEKERKEREAKLKEIRRLERERIEQQRKEAIARRKKEKEKNVYVNEEVKKEKKTVGDRINDFLVKLISFPKRWNQSIKEKLYNSSFAKNRRNQKEIKRNALLIDFEGADAEKSDTKRLYEYEARDADGKDIKGYFEAYSKVEVHSYLLSEGYTVYSIKTDKWIERIHALQKTSSKKIKIKDLVFFLTQLSTYIKAGIPLVDSLRILERQYKNKSYKRIFKAMIYDLTMGENFSTAMEKQGKAFPALLTNMIKTSEMTGSLPEVLDDMAEYYTETDKTRKEMITAMIYPSIVLVVALGVTVFIMLYVIPKFVEIYESMDASQIPQITLTILAISNFLKKYIWILLIGVLVFLSILVYCYRNVKLLRSLMQWIAMHIPVFGNIIIYNEVTMFTKTFASLLEHNVFITESMAILNNITNNEIYRMLILDTITNLAKGEKLSTAFEGHWAFPIPAYEMLVTGEKTGELPQMMRKVSEYYQGLHKNSVARIKTFIEPILIIFLTGIVGIIVLSIVIPMFNMYNAMEKVG